MNEKTESSRFHTGAFVLILIGFFLLLENLDLLHDEFWVNLWKFFPVFLILLGLKLLMGQSIISRWFFIITTLLVLGGIYIFSANNLPLYLLSRVQGRIHLPGLNVQQQTTEGIRSQDIHVAATAFPNVAQRDINIILDSGTLLVRDDAVDEHFHVITSNAASSVQPSVDTILRNSMLTIDYTVKQKLKVVTDMVKSDVHIGLSTIPTTITIKQGAGSADLLFHNLSINSLDYQAGAGTAILTLTEEALASDSARLQVGAGKITAKLPKNVNLDLSYSTGIGQIDVDGKILHGNGDQQFNGAGVGKTLNLQMEVGAGSIRVERY